MCEDCVGGLEVCVRGLHGRIGGVCVCVKVGGVCTLIASPSPPKTFCSVTDCLAYFSTHGLVELPNTNTDEDSYQLPRVTPIDPIVSYLT